MVRLLDFSSKTYMETGLWVSINFGHFGHSWTLLDYFFRWMSRRVALTHRRPAVPPHKAQAIAAFELLFIRASASLGLSP